MGRSQFGVMLFAVATLGVWRPCGVGAQAQPLTTSFTYQGQLKRAHVALGAATCDFEFRLFNAAAAGTQVGGTLTRATLVSDGLFTVLLDFGAAAFGGERRWLDIGVRCPPDTSFSAVPPRQEITAAPYALFALQARDAADVTCNGCIGAGELAPGAVGMAQIGGSSVGSAQIQDGAVGSADVAFNFAASASKGGAASDLACAGCVSAPEIGVGQVVKTLNGKSDAVTLQAGTNIAIATGSGGVTISATGVTVGPGLIGVGTPSLPLDVSSDLDLGRLNFPGPAGGLNHKWTLRTANALGELPALELFDSKRGKVSVSVDGAGDVINVNTDVRMNCDKRYKIGTTVTGEYITQPCTDGNYPIAFFGNSVERMRINNNGNVGIGTVAPSQRLQVAGNVLVNGNLTVSGGTKNFLEPHPTDPSKEIVYVSLEGGEAGTYIRGTARLVDGVAQVELPEHFRLVTGEQGLTVQVTARGRWLQLFVVEVTPAQLVVREAAGESGEFDYFVQGVRRGYEGHQVIRPRS